MYSGQRLRIYPTSGQQIALHKAFGACRWQETDKATGKNPSRSCLQGLVLALKTTSPWLADAHCHGLQIFLLNLSMAYKNSAQLSNFKSKQGGSSISYRASVFLGEDYLLGKNQQYLRHKPQKLLRKKRQTSKTSVLLDTVLSEIASHRLLGE